ncbi:GH3 auxin-responsive promoter family protein [Desulfobacula phenolica]|uniref:GH3 auxin-responsive promoter n=1 Tax=Desulfobacula phenolica TaxID=90732 RepID=A0A1H2FLZ0_9BACT|nr:GH3 auxin-responsive promoter family protein [Desulfobacula phenolica]SDU08332.1 GH3 auxin-responsive promoter [Desulfobacula phenolica]
MLILNSENWIKKRNKFIDKCRICHNELLKTCSEPDAVSAQILSDCVSRNRETDFGRRHNFGQIKTLTDYRRAVPIHQYADLEPWIQQILEGKERVLTVDAPYTMLKTSGTTGSSKAIPHTAHWRYRYRGPIIYALWGAYGKYFPQLWDHPYATLDFLWERELPKDFIGKIPHQGITNREISLGKTDFTPPWYNAPWVDFTDDSSGFMERIYLRIRHFIGQNLRMLAVIQPNRLLLMVQILSDMAERLIEDVHNGELCGKPLFEPKPELSARLEKLVLKDGILLPKSVWPNLDLIACWKSKQLGLYLEQIPALFPDTKILPLLTGSTEAMVTCPVDDHPEAGILTLTQGIYEFIPHDDENPDFSEENPETLSYDQLTVGKIYNVITTQANGLYRYDIGDLYQVVGYHGRVPRLAFVRRQGVYSSFNGEKLTETQVMDAFQAALGQLGLPSVLYSCFPVWSNPPRYVLIVEAGSDWPVSSMAGLPKEFDLALGYLNSEYEARIRTGRLARSVVKQVAPGTFQDNWNAKVAQGACAPQLKHHFCQKETSLLEEIESAGLVIETFF